jgi:hypothetical protein
MVGNPFVFASPPDTVKSVDSVCTGTISNRTTVKAFRGNGGTNGTGFSSLTIGNNTAPGTYPLNHCFISTGTGQTSLQIITANPVITIITFGSPFSGFIEGNFNFQMNFAGTT